MKFLLDVNASGAITHWLSKLGYDVLPIETIDPKMPDVEILALARSQQRIIVTTDQDFEEMIWREGHIHYGVLRIENLPRAQRLALLEYVFNRHKADLASGAIVVATHKKIRIRTRPPAV